MTTLTSSSRYYRLQTRLIDQSPEGFTGDEISRAAFVTTCPVGEVTAQAWQAVESASTTGIRLLDGTTVTADRLTGIQNRIGWEPQVFTHPGSAQRVGTLKLGDLYSYGTEKFLIVWLDAARAITIDTTGFSGEKELADFGNRYAFIRSTDLLYEYQGGTQLTADFDAGLFLPYLA